MCTSYGVKRPLEELEDPQDRFPLEEDRGGRLLVLPLGLSPSDCDYGSVGGTLADST
jgi:hypothetical protein